MFDPYTNEELVGCALKGRRDQVVLATNSLKDLRATLRAALSYAVADELVSRNVPALVKPPSARKTQVKASRLPRCRCSSSLV